MATADYPQPITVASTTGTGLQPNVLDVSDFITARLPPVVQIVISATATVVIKGSGRLSTTDPVTLIHPITFGGAISTSDFVDLIAGTGIFYQFDVTANTGTVTIYALPGASAPGCYSLPQLVRMTTAATTGL